ncbi:MAG: peroxiredoxin [Bacteroidota bacterium]
MAIALGEKAPNFILKNTEGQEVSLSSFRGQKNVVLLFFPLAFTGVCTQEMCAIRDNMNKYSDLDAEVLGVSVDSFFTLKKFKEQENLNFTLLSDFNKEAAQAYDSLYENFFDMNGVTKRSAFVIDAQGIIQYAEVLEDASELPDFDAIDKTLSNLQVASIK